MSEPITVIRRYNTSHQRAMCDALMAGMKAIGQRFFFNDGLDKPITTRRVAMWGWRDAPPLRKNGHDVLVMEHGYIGNRKVYSSLGWNGLNNNAQMPAGDNDGLLRFKEVGGVLKERNSGGKYALILGQLKGDASLYGINALEEYKKIIAWLEERGYEVRFRHHPRSIELDRMWQLDGVKTLQGDLDVALSRAEFTVCINSNSAVDSILAGVPCLALNSGTMAWPVCAKAKKDIGYYPNKNSLHKWASMLAHTQFTCEEIASGFPVARVLRICP